MAAQHTPLETLPTVETFDKIFLLHYMYIYIHIYRLNSQVCGMKYHIREEI